MDHRVLLYLIQVLLQAVVTYGGSKIGQFLAHRFRGHLDLALLTR
jgi:hypothetical protein